jgi:hypothetical protein
MAPSRICISRSAEDILLGLLELALARVTGGGKWELAEDLGNGCLRTLACAGIETSGTQAAAVYCLIKGR